MRKEDAPTPVRSIEGSASRGEERVLKADTEGDKKVRKELEELKKMLGELKDELKAAKKKIYEQKEAGKSGEDLVKARAEVERQASIQLETTRSELATA